MSSDQTENSDNGNIETMDARDSTASNLFDVVSKGDEEEIRSYLINRITKLSELYKVENYKIVFLFDDIDPISEHHADRIYSAISDVDSKKNILLVLQSRGGSVEPAYLLSKACKQFAKDKFISAVPRRAKSAATLICMGADEIHLGQMSQLGPIDLQINRLPASSLLNGLNKISELVCAYPASSEMWSKYLSQNLSMRQLGHLERLGESTAQYAERLLRGKTLPNAQTPNTLANHFVNHYKDHSFVIDLEEASSLLGSGIVRTGSNEYAFANHVYEEMDIIKIILEVMHKKEFNFIGAIDGASFRIRNIKD